MRAAAPIVRARGLRFWRSPVDQPPWARPLLLLVAGVAGVSYAWGMWNVPLEPFYAAAVRSMGSNWHDWFFGAVDPFGTQSVDKLPGAFWVQALFVRVLGFHFWVVVLPQVIAGILTVLVLYRAVRRMVGPKAGLVAALIVAMSPVTVLMNRGNVSDPLLVLLTVLAADATMRAISTGRVGSLLMAGVWVGLAFQTKMIQAWLVLPAVALAYAVSAPAPLRRRLTHLAFAGVITVLVSISWMTAVSLVPAHDRPYVDGTTNDSVFTQVFVYNGWIRIGIDLGDGEIPQHPEAFVLANLETNPDVGTFRYPASWHRLLTGPLGRDDGWLLPATVASIVGVVLARKRANRRDPVVAATAFWATWFVVLFGLFSGGKDVNSYYLGALVPAIAALCALGMTVAWRVRGTYGALRWIVAATVAITVSYDVWLVPWSAGDAWLLVPLAIGVSAIAIVRLVLPGKDDRIRGSRVGVGLGIGVVAILVVPALACCSVVAEGLGSFSTPFQNAAATKGTTQDPERFQSNGAYEQRFFEALTRGSEPAGIIDSTVVAAPYMMVTGMEFLPIGGYGGDDPAPTLAELEKVVSTKTVRFVLLPEFPPSNDPRVLWLERHCSPGRTYPFGDNATVRVYSCADRRSLTTAVRHAVSRPSPRPA